jgi:hypothetical protein
VHPIKQCFSVSTGLANCFSAVWSSKTRLGRAPESVVSIILPTLRTHFCLYGRPQNATRAISRKRCFKRSYDPENSFSAFWRSKNETSVKSSNRCFMRWKSLENLFSAFWPCSPDPANLDVVEKAMFQAVDIPCENIFCFWASKNVAWTRSRKRCFKWSTDPEYSFSAFWMWQNATFLKSIKQCFKRSKSPENLFSAF